VVEKQLQTVSADVECQRTLTTMVQPAASAGATFHVSMSAGNCKVGQNPQPKKNKRLDIGDRCCETAHVTAYVTSDDQDSVSERVHSRQGLARAVSRG